MDPKSGQEIRFPQFHFQLAICLFFFISVFSPVFLLCLIVWGPSFCAKKEPEGLQFLVALDLSVLGLCGPFDPSQKEGRLVLGWDCLRALFSEESGADKQGEFFLNF